MDYNELLDNENGGGDARDVPGDAAWSADNAAFVSDEDLPPPPTIESEPDSFLDWSWIQEMFTIDDELMSLTTLPDLPPPPPFHPTPSLDQPPPPFHPTPSLDPPPPPFHPTPSLDQPPPFHPTPSLDQPPPSQLLDAPRILTASPPPQQETPLEEILGPPLTSPDNDSPRKGDITIIVHMVSSPTRSFDDLTESQRSPGVTSNNHGPPLMNFDYELKDLDERINTPRLNETESNKTPHARYYQDLRTGPRHTWKPRLDPPSFSAIDQALLRRSSSHLDLALPEDFPGGNNNNNKDGDTTHLACLDLAVPRAMSSPTTNDSATTDLCGAARIATNASAAVVAVTRLPVPDLLCHSSSSRMWHEGEKRRRREQQQQQRHQQITARDETYVDNNNISTSQNLESNGHMAAPSTATCYHQLTHVDTIADVSTRSHQLQTHSDDEPEDQGFLPRFVRASMRRVRRFRLSARSVRDSPEVETSTSLDPEREDSSSSVMVDGERQEGEEERGQGHEEMTSLPPGYESATTELPTEVTPPPRVPPRIVRSPVFTPPASPAAAPSPPPANNTGPPAPLAGCSPLGTWPHPMCFTLAALGCTAGLFNLSRFAVLSVQFGGPFLIQFLILSLLFGVPLFLFHVALGHYLGTGVMDMWRISPVFQGVGIALLAGQALMGMYSVVGVSWLFVFFRDSFVNKQDHFKWAEPFPLYRGGGPDSPDSKNSTPKLEETVPDYFSGVVLQRYNLSSPDRSFGHFKFQVAFNLAVVWMIVFVSLSRGLKSYGKVVFVFVLLPTACLLMLCARIFDLSSRTSGSVFPETAWDEIINNNECWIAAASETFMTWGMLGIATMQAASQVAGGQGPKNILRDSLIVVLATVTILVLTAFLADACTQLLEANGYIYMHTSSFEHMSTAQFLKPLDEPLSLLRTSTRKLPHSSLFSGNRLLLPGSSSKGRKNLSGYQALRLATELLPATFAALGLSQIHPFWAILSFFTLILFGIAQLLAVWHSVITGIIAINSRSLKSWETTITFFTCGFGYILGLPLTTELGIWVVYFLDTVVGCGWWLALLHSLLLVAVLVVRGRPYNGETVANSLFSSPEDEGQDPEERQGRGARFMAGLRVWLPPLLSFLWSVVLPIILLVLSVVLFRTSESGELYNWSVLQERLYWPVWARELGSILQLMPVLVVPLVAVVQTCRYLSNGPPDLFDRIELLYRPAPWGGRSRGSSGDLFAHLASLEASTNANASTGTTSNNDDPPPKYTPPPSYSTASGARIAKLLRESIRRSVRRIAAASGSSSSGTERFPPPPDYASVLIEMQRASASPPVEATRTNNRPSSSSEMRTTAATPGMRHSTLTAQEVAHTLRSSFRRPTRSTPNFGELPRSSQTLPSRSKTKPSVTPGQQMMAWGANGSNVTSENDATGSARGAATVTLTMDDGPTSSSDI